MPNHLLNLPLLLQIVQRFPCQAAIDLQSVHERGDCDETVGLDVFVQFVGGGFVEDDGVVGLVLDFWREAESATARRKYLGVGRGEADGLEMEVRGNEGATYPCPLTTSSFASCRQMLLRVPEGSVSSFASRSQPECGRTIFAITE